jgi:ubiquinone/menaquinone biosynthesis C-methylase UbiE
MDEWHIRSETYDKLKWTSKNELLSYILKKCDLNHNSRVCEVGTGTGTLAQFIVPHCKSVDAIDISEDMLNIARSKNDNKNINFHLMNAEHLDFDSESFNVAISRMCFHHIDNILKAASECNRILKPNGKIVICEAVPPEGSLNFYIDMFKIKEKRHVFVPNDLVKLLEKSNFKDIHFVFHNMPSVSIRNWLKNSGLPKHKQDIIYDMWLKSDDSVKEGHKLTVVNDDIFVNWCFIIISGLKK